MTLEVEGKVVNTDEEGYLLDLNDRDECVAEAIAGAQGLELTGSQTNNRLTYTTH